MTTFLAEGSPQTTIGAASAASALRSVLARLGPRRRVLVNPPDSTRPHSAAGRLTVATYRHFGDAVAAVLPALGTHKPMDPDAVAQMFPGLPPELIRHHRPEQVTRLGEVPAEVVSSATGGRVVEPWPAEVSPLVADGDHDLIVSIGQVVPHEVAGMSNHAKNVLVGTAGFSSIDRSHYLAAMVGIEETLGRIDTPLRRLMGWATRHYLADHPLLWVLTVVGPDHGGTPVIRGLFVGDDDDCFLRAASLARAVNITELADRPRTVVCHLDPRTYSSLWTGNKAIYRTRLAIADGGRVIIHAPGVTTMAEHPELDRLIRRFGYRPRAEIEALVGREPELATRRSVAAHLVHGSAEGRFEVVYATGMPSADIEAVGMTSASVDAVASRYPPGGPTGWRTTADGEPYYYVADPGLGLWTAAAGI